MYFNYINNIQYNFGSDSSPNVRTMKNIFSRPTISTDALDYSRLDNNETPDRSADTLYDDSSLFYINLLLNNTLNKTDWPINEIDFTELLNDTYKGYSFHILETPEKEPKRGDVVIRTEELLAAEGESCIDDISCYPSFGIVEDWDPLLRKIWVRVFQLGTVSSISENQLFKEGNTFKLFRIDPNGTFQDDALGIQYSNSSAFDDDPNYTPTQETDGTYRTFRMKSVTKYNQSIRQFFFRGQVVSTYLNPYLKNISQSYESASYVPNYSAGNTNGTCSLLDAYILSASGATGVDDVPFQVDVRLHSKDLKDVLTDQNENKRYVNFLHKNRVGDVVEQIKKEYNG